MFTDVVVNPSLPLCRSRAGVSRSDDHLSAARPRLHHRGYARTQVHQDRLGHRTVQGQDRRHRRNPQRPRWSVNKTCVEHSKTYFPFCWQIEIVKKKELININIKNLCDVKV